MREQQSISILDRMKNTTALVGSDKEGTAGWYKVASQTMSGYINTNITFMVTSTYGYYNMGILQLQMRADDTSISCKRLGWLSRVGFNTSHYIIVISGMKWTLYAYQPQSRYGRLCFEILSRSSTSSNKLTYALEFANNETLESTTPNATVTSSDISIVASANTLSTTRTFTIGSSSKTFNGSANVSWSLNEIGAAASNHNHNGAYVYDKANSSGNMNNVAGYRNALGMINLTGTDTTINPNGQTGWHHFINMSYIETSGTNMWQTQIANKAGSTDLWVRSRSGGEIKDGTAWGAPWTRILTGSNYKNVVTPANIGAVNKAGDAMTGELAITKSGDGATLLKFNTERGWCFQQGGSGGNTTLDLVSQVDSKSFRILDSSKNYGMVVNTSSTGTSVSIDGNKVYHAGNKPTASEIGAAASNHTHSYLPLSGGTMTGSVSSSLTTGTHLDGNKGKAIINSTAAGSGYTMLAKMNSTNGVWTMGGWGTNFCLFYTANSTINAGTNSFTKQLKLLDEAGNSQFPGNVYATKVVVNAVDMGSSGGGMTTNIGSINIKGNGGGNFHMINESSSNSSSGSVYMRTNGNVYIRNKNNDSQSGMLRVNSIGGDGGYINLAGTLSSKTIYPDTNNAYDIGSNTMSYSKVYTNHIQAYMVAGKSGRRFTTVPVVNSDGVMEVGRVIDFHSTNDCTKDYGARIEFADSTTANSRGIVFSREITPANNATQDIGTAGGRWRNIYLINSPNVASKRELKTNINLFDDKNAYDNIKNLNIYTYNFKKLDEDGNWNGECEAENMLGSILDELPIECINEEANGVDLYAYTSYAISALKYAIQKIEKLEKELSELKK